MSSPPAEAVTIRAARDFAARAMADLRTNTGDDRSDYYTMAAANFIPGLCEHIEALAAALARWEARKQATPLSEPGDKRPSTKAGSGPASATPGSLSGDADSGSNPEFSPPAALGVRLREIEARSEAATSGPWVARDLGTKFVIDGDNDCIFVAQIDASYEDFDRSACEQDAAFIAAAREDVPWLAAQLRERDAELERVTADRDASLAVNAALARKHHAALAAAVAESERRGKALAQLQHEFQMSAALAKAASPEDLRMYLGIVREALAGGAAAPPPPAATSTATEPSQHLSSDEAWDGHSSVPLPERYWAKNTEGTTWCPLVLRSWCELHLTHPFDHQVEIHAGVVLFLLDATGYSGSGRSAAASNGEET